MKTPILNGSPRKNGDTMSLINEFLKKLSGDYLLINTYDCDISPCVDCRYCWKHQGCSIDDEMQKVYNYIEECDNILIASPVYFSELTGKLLDVGSRLQTYYCAKNFRKEKVITKQKKRAVIVVGGGDGKIEKAYSTAVTLLHHMNAFNMFPLISCHDTNHYPAIQDKNVVQAIDKLNTFFEKR